MPPRFDLQLILAGAVLAVAAAQRPGPGGGGNTCSTGAEGDSIEVGCPPGGVISSVQFARYGSIQGSCPSGLLPGSCGANISAIVRAGCQGQASCTIRCAHNTAGCCIQGVGTCCGCSVNPANGPSKFTSLPDPCPGQAKHQAFSVTCNNSGPSPGPESGVSVVDLRVNSLVNPITVDDPSPHFSWRLNSLTRGVLSEGYEIEVRAMSTGTLLWASGIVNTSQTSYIEYSGPTGSLESDSVYSWAVRAYPGPTQWANATFQTALMQQSDWETAMWIQAPGGDTPGQYASQMRKVFDLPSGAVIRATAFVALPGYGQVFVNGHQVDDPETGTRSLSQYDVRMLYHTYDITPFLKPGMKNVIAIYVGLGWFGHPAVPPQAKRFPFGPPTVRALLRVHTAASTQQPFILATDGTWQQTGGPVIYDDEYNGETYDARLETPGWTTITTDYPSGQGSVWTKVALSASVPGFALNNTLMSSADFQPIKVITRRVAEWVRSPAPGVYVYDFSQNEPGWCKLSITGPRGLAVQLRHAEILQHPPYGPEDGSVYVDNLRSAKATDIYVLKGNPAGETVEFSFTQHGFRYVELTYIGDDAGSMSPPTLESLEAINVRTSVDLTGDLTFGDDMLQHVHHNILWGQASNLMMVPSDCDQRDERFGWTGDSALTADEASNNFDLSAFYDNWARMLDDSSQNGAVACWVPGGIGHSSPPAGGSCDASWGSAFPSVVYALFKWSGDVVAPKKRWKGVTRFIDNEHSRVLVSIKNIFTGPGDWCPAPNSPDNPDFKAEPRVDPKFSSGFSFINDVAHVLEMAEALGYDSDVAKYKPILNMTREAFHSAWYDSANGYYVDGGQTAQVLALELDVMPTADIKAKVLNHLVQSIMGNTNHSTAGIIGWRYMPGVLSKNGYGDLAYALMTQTTYPSIGYEILGKTGEPSTTLWELWNSDAAGPSMNSRNHIMFGGNGVWLHTYIGGIDNAPDSFGYQHVIIAPPVSLVADAALNACCKSCGSKQVGTSSPPLMWTSATKTTVRGEFAHFWRVSCSNTSAYEGNSSVASVVVTLDVQIATNSIATTAVPVLSDPSTVVISEGSTVIWKAGAFVPGVKGIVGAVLHGDTIQLQHGSGHYVFTRSG